MDFILCNNFILLIVGDPTLNRDTTKSQYMRWLQTSPYKLSLRDRVRLKVQFMVSKLFRTYPSQVC